jgi:hypothetical protein
VVMIKDGVRSCPPYSTFYIANTAVPASPKCESSFYWSRLRATRSQKRIAMSAILAAPLVEIAVLATIGQPDSTDEFRPAEFSAACPGELE